MKFSNQDVVLLWVLDNGYLYSLKATHVYHRSVYTSHKQPYNPTYVPFGRRYYMKTEHFIHKYGEKWRHRIWRTKDIMKNWSKYHHEGKDVRPYHSYDMVDFDEPLQI